jgi:hypothetical protein
LETKSGWRLVRLTFPFSQHDSQKNRQRFLKVSSFPREKDDLTIQASHISFEQKRQLWILSPRVCVLEEQTWMALSLSLCQYGVPCKPTYRLSLAGLPSLVSESAWAGPNPCNVARKAELVLANAIRSPTGRNDDRLKATGHRDRTYSKATFSSDGVDFMISVLVESWT